jgi:hypothetical protein
MIKRKLTTEEQTIIDAIKSMPWSARFHRTLDNPTAPGGKIDMYLLVDDETGEGLVSVPVPHGQGFIAEWIAGCCADPWFIRRHEFAEMPDMAQAMNRGLAPFVKDGELDGYSASVAALTIFEAYMTALPKHARNDLANRLLSQVNRLRTS